MCLIEVVHRIEIELMIMSDNIFITVGVLNYYWVEM